MGALGGWELIIILLVVLVVFGPKKLPEMGRSLGKAIREFKSAGKDLQQEISSYPDNDVTPSEQPNSTTQGNGHGE